MRYTNKFSNGLRGLHRQQYGWGAFSVCWCNWYHCLQTYKPIFTKIGLQLSPSSPLGYSFCLFNSLCIRDRETGMLICELIAFLSRIANSLKCHYVQRARSYCHQRANPQSHPPLLFPSAPCLTSPIASESNMLLLICNNTWKWQINDSYDTYVPEIPLMKTWCT